MTNELRFDDQVAVITGAGGGLGKEYALLLASRGARVVVNDIGGSVTGDGSNSQAAETAAAEIRQQGGQAVGDSHSVTTPEGGEAIIDTALNAWGRVDIVINNAGIGRVDASALDPVVIDNAREIFETNFYGIIRASQAFTPVLSANGGGAIVNVLSDVTWFAPPMLTAYAATKSAAWSFTNALRIDVRDKGIQVLALHVGFLDTDLTRGLDVKKSDPRVVAARTLDALETGREEVLAGEQTEALKRSLSTEQPYYLNPPNL